MPLSNALDDVPLSLACPNCGHGLQKLGRWFLRASAYRCEGCGASNRITYDDKLKLFAAGAKAVP